MSNKKNKIHISQLYSEIDRIVSSNKLRGSEVTKRKLAKIRIGPNEFLGDDYAERVIQKYKKYITFGD